MMTIIEECLWFCAPLPPRDLLQGRAKQGEPSSWRTTSRLASGRTGGLKALLLSHILLEGSGDVDSRKTMLAEANRLPRPSTGEKAPPCSTGCFSGALGCRECPVPPDADPVGRGTAGLSRPNAAHRGQPDRRAVSRHHALGPRHRDADHPVPDAASGIRGHYQSVTTRLAGCDLIVAEGITGTSVTAWALTLAYRLPAHRRRLALRVQNIDYGSLGIPVIRPDITARQFRERWRSVPVLHRLAVWCLVAPFAVSFALLGTRRTRSRHVAPKTCPTPIEAQARQLLPQLTELSLDQRDALLADWLASVHEEHHNENFDVAVVYGAAHMPAITHELLRRYSYRPRTAEWLTVFDF
jgi:hypothetical protein